MPKSTLLLLLALPFFSIYAYSQIPGRYQVKGPVFKAGDKWANNTADIPVPIRSPRHYVAVALRCSGASTAGRFSIQDTLGRLIQLEDDWHVELPAGQRQFQLMFLPANTRHVRLWASELEADVTTELFFYSPVDFSETEPLAETTTIDRDACPCALPAYVNRAGWGGPPTQQPGCTPSYTNVTHLFVHHQAGVANPPYAAVVLGIWQHHVFTNGWCDVGYHWLIAPDGTVYQGRAGGNNVVGAHATGLNGNTMAVCFLGNFQNDQPTPEALASLHKLFAWKCCDSDIDPKGTSVHAGSGQTFKNISGHRDGANTLCPGDNLYAKLPLVRIQTDTLYSDPTGCDGLWPPDNDNCENAYTFFSSTTCMPTASTVDDATSSGVPIPTCNGFTSPTALDVWFRFGATEDHHQVTVTPTGNLPGALDAVVAVYSGSCATLQLVDCADTPGGPGVETILDLPDLTPGKIYYIRVYDYGNEPPTDGRFDICVTHGQGVSTGEVDIASGVILFPNPTQGRFTVRFSDETDGALRVFTATGKLVFREDYFSKETQLDLSGNAPGFYFVEIQTGQGIFRKAVILEK